MRSKEASNRIVRVVLSSLWLGIILLFGFCIGYGTSIGLLEVLSPLVKSLQHRVSSEFLLPIGFGVGLLMIGIIGCILSFLGFYSNLSSLPRGTQPICVTKGNFFRLLILAFFTGVTGFAIMYVLILISTSRLF